MKRKLYVIGAISLVALIFLCAIVYDDARMLIRHNVIESNIRSLKTIVESYRMDEGNYPITLADLQKGTRPELGERLKRILNDKYRDEYSYKLSSNVFEITVTAPNSWPFKKRSVIHRKIELDEVPKPAN